MKPATINIDQAAEGIAALAPWGGITLIAIAGPPGSGKSTLAEKMTQRLGKRCCAVPMDGFHLDNAILEERGMLASKGAPETFDHGGFATLIDDLKAGKTRRFPTFDRDTDSVIEDGGLVPDGVSILLFEGNYLLFDEPGWSGLARKWDASIWLDVPEDVLEERLTKRWRDQGMPEDLAIKRAQSNDLVNARRILSRALPSTWIIGNGYQD
ncbi:AAA family ATPase [Alphaproteobacteria bacterium LSUCC0684]